MTARHLYQKWRMLGQFKSFIWHKKRLYLVRHKVLDGQCHWCLTFLQFFYWIFKLIEMILAFFHGYGLTHNC